MEEMQVEGEEVKDSDDGMSSGSCFTYGGVSFLMEIRSKAVN